MAIALEQSAVTQTSDNTTSYESDPITIGSGSDRLLVAVLHGYKDAGADPGTINSVTFGAAGRAAGTGTALTVQVSMDGTQRCWTAIATLVAPPSGAGTVQIEYAIGQRANGIGLAEFSGVDQTAPVASVDSMISAPPGALSFTTANDGAMIVSGLGGDSGNSGPFSVSPGTELYDEPTGGTGFNDTSLAAAITPVATAGAQDITWTWTKGQAIAAAIELVPAATAGGGVALDGTLSVTSAISGALSQQVGLAGTLSASSSLTGALDVLGQMLLSGTIQAQSSAEGTLSQIMQVSGQVNASSDLSGLLGLLQPLAGSIAGQSATVGTLTQVMGLAGSIDSTTAAVAALWLDLSLSGDIEAASTLEGALSGAVTVNHQYLVVDAIRLRAALSGTPTLQAALDGALSIKPN